MKRMALVYMVLVSCCTLAMCVFAQHPESGKAANEYERTKTEVDAAYKMLMEAYGGNEEAKASLKVAQEAWKKYRDAEAKSAISFGYSGGHPQAIAFYNSGTKLAKGRIAILKEKLQFVYMYKRNNYRTKNEADRIQQMLDEIIRNESDNR